MELFEKRLAEALLMSIHYICNHGEIKKKNISGYPPFIMSYEGGIFVAAFGSINYERGILVVYKQKIS